MLQPGLLPTLPQTLQEPDSKHLSTNKTFISSPLPRALVRGYIAARGNVTWGLDEATTTLRESEVDAKGWDQGPHWRVSA